MSGLVDPAEQAERWKEEGNALLAAHRYGLAAEKYSAAIALNGENAIYYSNRAQALIKLESYGMAIEDANEAIRCVWFVHQCVRQSED
jgi:tetratricopeptide (TPR) repeat protein